MMNWEKLGNIFCPSGEYPWMLTHASTPYGKFISENLLRIYFTCRDQDQKSYISCLDFNMNSFKIENISPEPIIEPGIRGLFDDSGVAMGCLIEHKGIEFLYYVGWNLKVTVPWLNTIGLAIKNEETGKFKKYSLAPVMDRSNEDPFSISYPSILSENGLLKMWYGSNLSWGVGIEDMNHIIKYAESYDGITWKRSDSITINLEHKGEYAISRPSVIQSEEKKLHMWYAYRVTGNNYKIGFADSRDGNTWIRKDHIAGLVTSKIGWDSEMVCYPFVFIYKEKYYMLYNGNGYGLTGMGLAVLKVSV